MCGETAVQKQKKRYRIPERSNGRKNMADIFREYVLFRYPGYIGQSVECDNCGMKIKTLKFENISHIEPKSLAPSKAHDFDNFEILCGPTDYWGKVDTSCHTLHERNFYDEFKKKTKK